MLYQRFTFAFRFVFQFLLHGLFRTRLALVSIPTSKEKGMQKKTPLNFKKFSAQYCASQILRTHLHLR